MNRDQAKNLVKMYDGQFPEENLELYLDYYEMTKEEFQDVINFKANKDILKFEKGNGYLNLRLSKFYGKIV